MTQLRVKITCLFLQCNGIIERFHYIIAIAVTVYV